MFFTQFHTFFFLTGEKKPFSSLVSLMNKNSPDYSEKKKIISETQKTKQVGSELENRSTRINMSLFVPPGSRRDWSQCSIFCSSFMSQCVTVGSDRWRVGPLSGFTQDAFRRSTECRSPEFQQQSETYTTSVVTPVQQTWGLKMGCDWCSVKRESLQKRLRD